MKKTIIAYLILSVLFSIVKVTAHALDFSIGAAGWYANWKFKSEKDDNENFTPCIMYGPIASIGFAENWTVSTVFLYGKFKNEHDGDSSKIARYDSDTTLKYRINRYFRIFMGLKFMGYSWDAVGGNTGRHQSFGPGLGIGFILPVKNNFYMLYDLSGIYARGYHRSYNSDPGYIVKNKTDVNEYIFNTCLSVAYYIKPASTIMTLGFRYQYIISDLVTENDADNDVNMIFYGILLSATYSF